MARCAQCFVECVFSNCQPLCDKCRRVEQEEQAEWARFNALSQDQRIAEIKQDLASLERKLKQAQLAYELQSV